MMTIDHHRMNTPLPPPLTKKLVTKILKTLNILCILTTVTLLLTACDSPSGSTASNDNQQEQKPTQPKPKFAVTYSGIYATASGTPPAIDVGSGNDGSSLAKAYTITLNTDAAVAPAGLIVVGFRPTFKPAAAKTDATFAIQAIDPTTGADLTDTAEVFNTKFVPKNLFFQAEATTFHPSLPGHTLNPENIGSIINVIRSVPVGTKIPASNTGHLAYKITITPKPGSAYDGPKAIVFVKIAIRG